jgi:hypothetical protein
VLWACKPTSRHGCYDDVLDQRGADMADLLGGANGLLVRGYKGKEAERLVTRIGPSVVSLVAELRGHGSDLPGKAFGACFR